MINIIEALADSRLFGQLLRDPETWANWRTALRAVFALPIRGDELKIYQQFTGRSRPPSVSPKEVFFVIGRRGGKSFISAIIAIFLSIFLRLIL